VPDEAPRLYELALADVPDVALMRAAVRCLNECTFWPTVAEVRKAVGVVAPSALMPLVTPAPEVDEARLAEQIREMWAMQPDAGPGWYQICAGYAVLGTRAEALQAWRAWYIPGAEEPEALREGEAR